MNNLQVPFKKEVSQMAENRTFNQIFPDSNSFTSGLPQEYLEYMQSEDFENDMNSNLEEI